MPAHHQQQLCAVFNIVTALPGEDIPWSELAVTQKLFQAEADTKATHLQSQSPNQLRKQLQSPVVISCL